MSDLAPMLWHSFGMYRTHIFSKILRIQPSTENLLRLSQFEFSDLLMSLL